MTPEVQVEQVRENQNLHYSTIYWKIKERPLIINLHWNRKDQNGTEIREVLITVSVPRGQAIQQHGTQVTQ